MTPKKKLLLIHPETFQEYLNSLPKNERGWVAFDFVSFDTIKGKNSFANIFPSQEKQSA